MHEKNSQPFVSYPRFRHKFLPQFLPGLLGWGYIFLGDRVVVMTTRPAKTKKIVEVQIERPRDYTLLSSEEIRLLVAEAKGAVHEEAIKAFEAGERELA